eukprot:1372069-Amorphochlora_amoeboformis.AAC.2
MARPGCTSGRAPALFLSLTLCTPTGTTEVRQSRLNLALPSAIDAAHIVAPQAPEKTTMFRSATSTMEGSVVEWRELGRWTREVEPSRSTGILSANRRHRSGRRTPDRTVVRGGKTVDKSHREPTTDGVLLLRRLWGVGMRL